LLSQKLTEDFRGEAWRNERGRSLFSKQG
jgi:hypothetical protein